MKKEELTYIEIQGVCERLFFVPTTGVQPLGKDYHSMFTQLSKEQVLAMLDFARNCKKYENGYNKSNDKFHWCLSHAEQYRELREFFVWRISSYMPKGKDISLITYSQTFQENHTIVLKDCVKKNPYRWIGAGETIEIHGLKLARGLFYIGDYFKIPQSYKRKKIFNIKHREYHEYNRNYKLQKLYGTVIHANLPISNDKLKIVPFSSYLDMHPTHRYEYLEWLTGQKTISEVSLETFLFYLFGLQLRMFIDDTTTEQERLDIVNNSIELYIQCKNENVYCPELVSFIDASISKYFINKLEKLVPADILPHLTLCREAIILDHRNNNKEKTMENICRNIFIILNHDNSIQKHLLTDSFYIQFASMVESELVKMSYKWNWERLQAVINRPESSEHYEQYCMNSPQENSLLFYDYIFTFRLFPNISSIKFFNQCINNCYKRIVNRLNEYRVLRSELPSSVSSSISLFDADFQNIHNKIHRIITKDESFATIEKETNASEYAIEEGITTAKQGITLNDGRLAEVEKQTKQAQGLLSSIFDNNDEESSEKYTENDVLLDTLAILLTKESWKRNEVESLCKERHLMIGSVLEQINDYSYSKIEDAVIEDDGDTIYVMTEYKDKLI